LKIHFNIILPSAPRLSKWLFPSGVNSKIPYAPQLSIIHSTCSAHLISESYCTAPVTTRVMILRVINISLRN